jgi:hypothetical protein
MGTTEESIVYQLLSGIRAGELSNDEVISERRIRSFLRNHRANIINKFSIEGMAIADECFQKVQLDLKQINAIEWQSPVPNIIGLFENFGIKFTTPGFTNIAVEPEESYNLGKFNPINKFLPSAKIEDSILTLRVPAETPYAINDGKGIKTLLACLKVNNGSMIMSAVLNNPDDGIGYNWKTSKYPMPAETIKQLKDDIIRSEFQLILGTKSDQVPNAKNDTQRANEQGVQQ